MPYRGKHPKSKLHFDKPVIAHHINVGYHKLPEDQFGNFFPFLPRNTNFTKTEYFPQRRHDHSVYLQDGQPPVLNSWNSYQQFGWVKRRVYGPNVTNYRERIREGKDATTTADLFDAHWRQIGNYQWDLVSYFNPVRRETHMYGSYFDTLSAPSQTVPTWLDDQAKTKFIRYALKAQRQIKGGEFIHDLGKTIRSFHRVKDIFLRGLLRHTTHVLTLREQFLGADHRTGRITRKAFQKKLSDNWLEFNFGIKPTVADLQDIAYGLWHAYDRAHNGVCQKRIMGYADDESLNSRSFTIAPNSSNSHSSQMRVKVFCYEDVYQSCAYYGAVRLLRSDMGTIAGQELGLSSMMNDFIPTIWELIPYSWLVDYFTNISQLIDAWCFPRSDVIWITRRVRNITRSFFVPESTIINSIPGVIISNNFSATPGIYTRKAVLRSPYVGGLIPSFRWHLPYRGSDYFNILAVIGGMLTKGSDFR